MPEDERKEFLIAEINRYLTYIESSKGLEFIYNFIKKAVTVWK